jgi:hypothetical protein
MPRADNPVLVEDLEEALAMSRAMRSNPRWLFLPEYLVLVLVGRRQFTLADTVDGGPLGKPRSVVEIRIPRARRDIRANSPYRA